MHGLLFTGLIGVELVFWSLPHAICFLSSTFLMEFCCSLLVKLTVFTLLYLYRYSQLSFVVFTTTSVSYLPQLSSSPTSEVTALQLLLTLPSQPFAPHTISHQVSHVRKSAILASFLKTSFLEVLSFWVDFPSFCVSHPPYSHLLQLSN